jgi:predicted transcriptional regulator
MKKKLELESRREILELITEIPGIHFREIMRHLETSPGNLSYHLNYLKKHELVVVVKDENLKRYFPSGKLNAKEKKILAVLRNEISRGFVLFLLLNPESEFSKIANNFDLKLSKISYYLSKLVDKGILTKKKSGRNVYYSIIDEEEVANVLISYKPTFLDALVESFIEAWTKRD